MKFSASAVNISKDENDILMIGFLEDENYDNYVVIQFSNDFEEQDKSFNWSKYYLELSKLGGCYSCIDTIILTKKHFEISLNDYGKKVLNYDKISISYDISLEEFTKLQKYINIIFKDEEKIVLKSL
ncbi:hypothetical protein GCM10011514_05290 [Emticicia aquatilis]|uniref:Immunity protein 10 n=1 Tax=Emticicia aquatilis TaxID=1537369 RepID=A0A916YH19_9BACT|nr:Imm10 family immunity protein [Emticicia aquatilis]GGD44296.1 hypothetical protein GCM10011514_05290 [Emticicia aquatilis]